MKANLIEKTIEMNKSEAKAAGIIGSAMCKELKQYMEMYPTFAIKVKVPTKKKNSLKLTYQYMEKYIRLCKRDNKDALLKTFYTMIGKNEEGTNDEFRYGYFEVKAWFLETFAEVANRL